MDLYFWMSALLGTFSFFLSAGLTAPAADPLPASEPHLRTKRCSCATFMDKECVYFCHLDIIWVNTPERVVSYGLGNAPRTRRSVPGHPRTGTRCRCLREGDSQCSRFCRRDQRGGQEQLSASVQTRTPLEKWRRHRSRQQDALSLLS